MSSPLSNGIYHVFFVSYSTNPPLVYPLGFQEGDPQLYILPPGSKPALFACAREQPGQGDRNYAIVTTTTSVATKDGTVVASSNPEAAAHKWFVLRGAPSPPPIGRDSFAVFVKEGSGSQAWYPKSIPAAGDKDPVPVVLGDSGYPWLFTSA